MSNCGICGIEKEKHNLRRGMCLSCYRKETGLSRNYRGIMTGNNKDEFLRHIQNEIKLVEGRLQKIKEINNGIEEMEKEYLSKLKLKYESLQ